MGRRGAAAWVALLLVASACSTAGDRPDGVTIVVTTTPLGDLVRQVAGDAATVEVLLPIGADAHSFQPSSRQAAALQDADLVVANGLGLEEGLRRVLETAAADGTHVLEVAPLLDPIPFAGGECHPDEEAGAEPEADDGVGCDPHVWLDPLRMAAAARIVADELSALDPSVDWRQRAEAFAATMGDVDEEIEAIVAEVPGAARRLVTNHDALGYFADRYGFEVIGVVIPGGSTLADPSSAELAALVATIEESGVRAIFAETSEPTALAEAVAAEAGSEVAVVELFTSSLGEPGSGAETLAAMLVTDARLIAAALSG